ncbi:oligosaccharide flippase family protein [Janibacter hoylei]|uniref:oligosaccharide flippase family protein n=1 Tax=Janibacter hoylei TaxID=364298 RepID=UPI0022381D24|nr:oligosaccharide flippase family protein [Janibacter hoylei]MCW4600572.1 oligosaccharide flippase family protein [Janibacter hoylei]
MSASAEPRTKTVGSSGWLLGVCMGLSNVLGYAFVLLVSRSLGPADFGAFSAVNNTAIFLSLPASAFQVVVAAHQARGHAHRSGIGLSLVVGGTLALLTVALAPFVAHAFHLGSPAAMVLVALMMPAYTLTGAAQGLLLGHRRFAALAAVYVAISSARVLSAIAAAATGAGVVGVFGWLVLAAWAPALMSLWLARRHVQRWRRLEMGLVRELLTSNGTLAVLLAMTSTDVLLARHLLTAHDAGAYAFAGLFGKVVFWGTQFVALTLVPVASRGAGRRPVFAALGLVLGLGAVGILVVGVVPEQPRPRPRRHRVPRCGRVAARLHRPRDALGPVPGPALRRDGPRSPRVDRRGSRRDPRGRRRPAARRRHHGLPGRRHVRRRRGTRRPHGQRPARPSWRRAGRRGGPPLRGRRTPKVSVRSRRPGDGGRVAAPRPGSRRRGSRPHAASTARAQPR